MDGEYHASLGTCCRQGWQKEMRECDCGVRSVVPRILVAANPYSLAQPAFLDVLSFREVARQTF